MPRTVLRLERQLGRYWVFKYQRLGPFLSLCRYWGPYQHRTRGEQVLSEIQRDGKASND